MKFKFNFLVLGALVALSQTASADPLNDSVVVEANLKGTTAPSAVTDCGKLDLSPTEQNFLNNTPDSSPKGSPRKPHTTKPLDASQEDASWTVKSVASAIGSGISWVGSTLWAVVTYPISFFSASNS